MPIPHIPRIALPLAMAIAALWTISSAQAQPAAQPPMVLWVIPALKTNVPQTPEQAEAGRKFGRELPPPEVLQPTLDPGLPAYEPRRDIAVTGTFKGASSDVLVVLVQKWFEKFKTYHSGVTLSIAPPYAGSVGATELVKGDLDFVFVSRELRPADIGDFKAKFGHDPLSVPVSGGSYRHYGALDAVGFFVHKDNPLEQITFDQLDAMYSKTHHRSGKAITRWGELGPTGEWSDKPVQLYGIQPWNGFEEFIRQRVLSKDGKRGEWREDIKFEKVVFPMAKHVADDRYGIGYSGIAYIDAGVKMIPVVANPGDAPQAPTYENVALATYPLARLIFFNVNKTPGKPLPPALEEFMRFVLSREGQQVVLDHARYIPLRANQVRDARALLAP
jgi:phosphate transport system substrate-binding protein